MRVPLSRSYTSEQYRDLLNTYSSMQMMDSAARIPLVDDLISLAERQFGGTVTAPQWRPL